MVEELSGVRESLPSGVNVAPARMTAQREIYSSPGFWFCVTGFGFGVRSLSQQICWQYLAKGPSLSPPETAQKLTKRQRRGRVFSRGLLLYLFCSGTANAISLQLSIPKLVGI
jgi:hypothetical protein